MRSTEVPENRAADATTVVVETCQSRWVFELGRHRYLRYDRDREIDVATQFGSWRTFDHVRVSDSQLEVKEPGQPVLRAQIHHEACACDTAHSAG